MNVTVTFTNTTPGTAWTFAIFLTLPGQSFDSVSWKQTTAAPSGKGLPLSWCTGDLGAAIGSYDTDLTYTTRQILSAELGSQWQIAAAGDSGQLEADGSALLPTQIQILNSTGQMANPGLGVDGAGALFRRDLPSGASAVFNGTPAYFVAAFDTVIPGQLITTSTQEKVATTAFIGPCLLDFTQGATANVRLDQEGQILTLDVTYV